MPHIVWLYDGSLDKALDAATWLDTTNELRELGWRVTLVAAGPLGQQCIRDVEVFCIPRPEKYLLRQIVYHLRFLKFLQGQMKDIDIILFHPMSALWFLPVRLMRIFNGKQRPLLVMDIRSIHMPQRSKQGWKGWLRVKFQDFVHPSASLWIDGYLTITKRMAEVVHIPLHKFWGEWPSGVNPDLFAPAQTVRCWPSPGQSVHLVYIGALHPERNLMALCRAVEKANEEDMAFTLLLIGDGTERADLERVAARSDSHILVATPVPHDQIPEILAWAHIGVLPFPDEEKFRVSSPIKLFEYMAAGLPILATRIQCHTDVIREGDFVFWAENADVHGLVHALRLTWGNRISLSEIGKRAALAAQDWTWQASAKKLKAALELGMNTIK
jgi:glycosyltransferase involved in cell wall biosynthesis